MQPSFSFFPNWYEHYVVDEGEQPPLLGKLLTLAQMLGTAAIFLVLVIYYAVRWRVSDTTCLRILSILFVI
jgi:hypothetical protein